MPSTQMTSREVIRRVLTHDHPPRIGLTLPEPYIHDLYGTNIPAKPGEKVTRDIAPLAGEHRRWLDEWGNTWATLHSWMGGEIIEGGLKDWSQLETYPLPDLDNPARYEQLRQKFADTTQFRIGSISGYVFIHSRNLRKLENYLADVALEQENVLRLHRRVRDLLLRCVDRWADLGADAVMIYEDWGMQDRLLVSPAMWRQIFKPDFVELCRKAHGRGLFVFMHSCGRMTDVLPDLVEAGIDCFQFDQPRIHGIDTLAKYHGRATFWCPVDIQRTLSTRDPEKIRADAKLMIERLGQGGGFIGGYYSGNEAIGITAAVQDIACKAFMEFAERV